MHAVKAQAGWRGGPRDKLLARVSAPTHRLNFAVIIARENSRGYAHLDASRPTKISARIALSADVDSNISRKFADKVAAKNW